MRQYIDPGMASATHRMGVDPSHLSTAAQGHSAIVSTGNVIVCCFAIVSSPSHCVINDATVNLLSKRGSKCDPSLVISGGSRMSHRGRHQTGARMDSSSCLSCMTVTSHNAAML